MHEAITTCFRREPGFFIYLLGWWLDDDFDLSDVHPNSTFSNLCKTAAEEYNVQVRVMLWKNLLLGFPLNRTTQERQKKQFDALRGGACILDIFGPSIYHSHHQKVLVIKGSQGLVGFCGGLDIAKDRIGQQRFHVGSPFHDVHCRIRGDATADLIALFVNRWLAHPDAKAIDDAKGQLRGLTDRSPRGGGARTGLPGRGHSTHFACL
jgi:phosphatidylserine/phosphatidylglycerophosphate/cardiolipin synthase-like enzyme